jgi:hypothetical protein
MGKEHDKSKGHGFLTKEEKRLVEDKNRDKYWKRWGPYLSERQWVGGQH